MKNTMHLGKNFLIMAIFVASSNFFMDNDNDNKAACRLATLILLLSQNLERNDYLHLQMTICYKVILISDSSEFDKS